MSSDLNILKIENISKYFGGLAAVSNCSLTIKRGTITGIIGPNGSGKTTLFNLIAGNLKSSKGNSIFSTLLTYALPGSLVMAESMVIGASRFVHLNSCNIWNKYFIYAINELCIWCRCCSCKFWLWNNNVI